MLSDALLGAGLAFVIVTVTTPVGISGAVFLVPVQVSLLHTPSPSVTPTNLLYNLIATPGGAGPVREARGDQRAAHLGAGSRNAARSGDRRRNPGRAALRP